MKNKRPAELQISEIMLGFMSQVGQVLLLRELMMVFHGNELSIGLILAAWLIWVGVGSFLGVFFVKRFSSAMLAVVGALAVVPVLPGTILIIRHLRGFFDLPPGAFLSLRDIAFSALPVMAPLCLLLGAQFVFLASLRCSGAQKGAAAGTGRTYAGEALGNVLGGLAFTFLLVRLLDAFQVALLSSALMLTAALYTMYRAGGHASIDRGRRLKVEDGAKEKPTRSAFKVENVMKVEHAHSAAEIDSDIQEEPTRSAVEIDNDMQEELIHSAVIIENDTKEPSPCVIVAAVALVMLVAAAVAFFFAPEADRWTYRRQWSHFSPEHELVQVYQSRHGAIAILKLEDQFSFYQSGHLLFSAAGVETVSPELEEREALEFAHLAMVQHSDPRRVLLIGGGLRGMLGAIAEHPVERIDYVELDETLTAAARRYLSPRTLSALDDHRVRLVHGDGRLFVKESEERYDLIVVDAPDPATAVLNRFYTREFFQDASALLNSGGVLATGVVSTPDLRGTAIANRNSAIYHTLSAVFERVLPAGERFLYFFATDYPEQITADAAVLEQRFASRQVRAADFDARSFQTVLEEGPLHRLNSVLRRHGRAEEAHLTGPPAAPLFPPSLTEQELAEDRLPPVEQRFFINSDFKPIVYFYTLMFRHELTRAEEDRAFEGLLRTSKWWLLFFPALSLGTVLLLRPRARRNEKRRDQKRLDLKFAVMLAVWTTGFSTMTLQIALLFSFQALYGFVYEMVGLIIALFMAGLFLGALLVSRKVEKLGSPLVLAAVQGGIALAALAMAMIIPRAAVLPGAAPVFFAFALLTFCAGFINGIDFPLAVSCFMQQTEEADKTAGIIYGVELCGACAGAVLAGVLVVPIFGIIACCYLAALVNGVSFMVLLISGRE